MKTQELDLGMFKAFDIRTRDELLPDQNASRLMEALAFYFLAKPRCSSVVLGRDARLGVPHLMQMAADIFTSYGIDVILNPLQISTCQFYYSCMQNPGSAGIMFTASHNPGSYVGLKIVIPPMIPLSLGNGIEDIRQLYKEGRKPSTAASHGRIIIARYLDSFIDYSLSLAGVKKDSLKSLSLCLDFLSGAAGTEITEALQFAGASVLPRNLIPDGRFPSGDPNPIVISSIKPAWEAIKNGSFDFGLAFDGDGDRMDFITGRGEQLAPSFNFSIILPRLTKLFRPLFPRCSVYSDVKVNPLALSLQAAAADVQIIRNGHSFIKEALRERQKEGCIAACEESAHYYMNFPYDINDFSKGFAAAENTLFFALLTSRSFSENPEAYSLAKSQQDHTFRAREWPVHFNEKADMERALADVKAGFSSRGLAIFEKTADGRSLDSVLMRSGIPEIITEGTDLSGSWYQVVQRISRSEDNIARWEVTGSSQDMVDEARIAICKVIDSYADSGKAQYVS
ncbi:MAG: hypothetical protein ACQGQO_04225 [Sphaerochaetaceae bacterium]